jgi:hypothetical protein
MSKLRDGSTSSTPPPPVSIPIPSPSATISYSQARRAPSAIPLDTRSSSSTTTKTMPKSRSTQNLILPTTSVPNSTAQQSKVTSSRRVKISRAPRRPPNLPTSTNIQCSTSSSSSSSNTSSPTKTKQTHVPCSQDSILPLRELDNSTNDMMPKWAQDCFYRTVVLGLKPLLLQDIPASPIKHSTSTSSMESSDSLETTSELLNNNKETQVRRSISIPDYKQIETTKNKEK